MSTFHTLPVIVFAQDATRNAGALIERFDGRAIMRVSDVSTAAKVKEATEGADAVVVALQRLPCEFMRAIADTVRVIGRMGIGLDTLDLETAAALGITVFNEPTYGVSEVATHAVSLLLALHRRLIFTDSYVRDGWHTGQPFRIDPFVPIDDMTVGIIGFGRIGRTVASALQALTGELLAFDPLMSGGVPDGVTRVDRLDELLERSQAITIHAPLTAETKGLLGRRELEMLPRGALVVNVSRGGQVDEEALADLLTGGHLAGAGLDVFDVEPLPADSPLLHAPNTLFSPHSAAYSARSTLRLETWTVTDAIEWLRARQLVHGSMVVPGTRLSGKRRHGRRSPGPDACRMRQQGAVSEMSAPRPKSPPAPP